MKGVEMEMRPGKVIVDAETICRRVEALGGEVTAVYDGSPVMLLGVLDGSIVFIADLIRQLRMPLEIALVKVSTYGGSTSPVAQLCIGPADLPECRGRNILVVDDIYDSGATLGAVCDAVAGKGARSVRACAFLEKDCPHKRLVTLDFVGFKVPDLFVVGYGLDYAGKYRNLPHIAALEGYDEGPARA